MRRILSPRCLVIVSLLFAIGACASIAPPSASELSGVEAGEKAIVLLRIMGKDPAGNPLRAFKEGLVDDSVGLSLGSPETGGVPKGRIERVRYLSAESRDRGWTYLVLAPGTHYLAVQPPRWNNLFTYLELFKTAPRWVIEVPPKTPLVYAGTLELYGTSEKGWLFGNDIFTGFDRQLSMVRDESAAAAELGAKHFPNLGPAVTVLMEPQRPLQ